MLGRGEMVERGFSRAAMLSAGVAMAACCTFDHSVHSVDLMPVPNLGVGVEHMWIGDSIQSFSTAGTQPQQYCYRQLYTSASDPGRFTYRSDDTLVAAIDRDGRMVARGWGVTQVSSIAHGVAGTLWVSVGPPVTTLRFTVTPAGAKVGDTVTVRVDALDANGAAVEGAEIYQPSVAGRKDSLGTWLPGGAVAGYPSFTLPTPLVERLVVLQPGPVKIYVAVAHDVPFKDRVDSATFVAIPP